MSKIAYLTIDDSPSKYLKEKVNFLYEKNIPAIFFSRGDLLEKYSEDALYAIKKGFIIGNHAYSHRPFSSLSLKECKKEIRKTDEIIDKLYMKTKVKIPMKLFRFPGGDKGIPKLSYPILRFSKKFKEIQKFLYELGYKKFKFENLQKRFPQYFFFNDIDIYWTFDTKEWVLESIHQKKNQNIDDILKRIDKNISTKKKNEIILVHDHEQTHKYFKKVIDKLISKDFEFKLPEFYRK